MSFHKLDNPASKVVRAQRATEFARDRVVAAVGLYLDNQGQSVYRYALRTRYREFREIDAALQKHLAA